MAVARPVTYFENRAGLVLEHPAAHYAELRYSASRRQAGDLAALLTSLGRLLLQRGWARFLADNRQMTPFSASEKEWFTTYWLGGEVARPAPLLGVIILPAEVIARLSVLELVQHPAKRSLRYVTFTDPAEAQAYVSQPLL